MSNELAISHCASRVARRYVQQLVTCLNSLDRSSLALMSVAHDILQARLSISGKENLRIKIG